MIVFVGLIIMLVGSVVAFLAYLCSLLSRNNKQSTNRQNNMKTHDSIEHQFCEYMVVPKSVTHRHINLETACQKMEVTPNELTEYLKERLNTTFSEMVHEYRIEEAKESWEKSGKIPISKIAYAVGYGSSMAFLYHFIRQELCLSHVWKGNNLIII